MSKDLPYKLSETLVGHNEDVKDCIFLNPSTIISCSRDATVRIWSTEEDQAQAQTGEPMQTEAEGEAAVPTETEPGKKPRTRFNDTINSNAAAFVNALAYIQPDEEHPKGLIISAGQEGLLDVRPPGLLGPDAQYLLVGHGHNVCSLDVNGSTIISGSWDQTAIVWKNWEKHFVLQGHTAAVWAVLAISDTEFITGCADLKIRWYKGDKQIRSIQAHTEPVRGLCRLPDGGFASCGNDGTIRTWTMGGDPLEVIYGHTAYIYSIVALPNGQIASCGEDRTLKIWQKSQCLQTITHPALSVWCVSACSNGDLVTGASDGVLRVWSRDPERQADEEAQKAYAEAVANTSIAEESTGQEINKESLPGMSALGRPGKQDGETIHINNNGNVEAYRWTAAETTWEQVGVVAGAVSSGRKVEYEGKNYDYVFDVDFDEGKPPLKLPFNVNQNPWDAARIFLERNELPITYLDTTANFIVQNTKATRIGQESAPQTSDPWGTESRYRPGDELKSTQPLPKPQPKKVLPYKQYLDIATSNLDLVSKKIVETNTKFLESGEKEKSLNDDDLKALKALVAFLNKPSAPTSASAKTSQAVLGGLDLCIKIIREWPVKFPGLDLLRLLARFSPAVPLYKGDGGIMEVLESVNIFDASSPNNVMFGTRMFLNMFHTAEGLQYVKENYEEILKKVLTASEGTTNRTLKISVDTLLLNYSVLYAKSSSEEQAVALLEVVIPRIEKELDPEVLYRSMMTLGNLLTTGKLAAQAAKEIYSAKGVVSEAVKKVDSQKEKRIVDLGVEIELLLSGKR